MSTRGPSAAGTSTPSGPAGEVGAAGLRAEQVPTRLERRARSPAPAARRATTRTDPSGCSRTKAMVSSSTCAQRSPPRRRATCARRTRARSAYAARVVRSHSSRPVPRHRAAGVLAVDALEPDLVAGEEHRHAGQGELQAGRDPVHGRVAADDGADPGGVVGAEDVPARRGRPPAERALPGAQGLDDRRAVAAGHRHRSAEGARRATPGRAATTTPATRSRSSSSCRASRRRRRRRSRRGCARR